MGGKRNRSVGHRWERDCARAYRECGHPHVVTTRSESKARDDTGIDLMNKDEFKNGLLRDAPQCKCTLKNPDYHKLITELPEELGMPVVLHRKTEKQGKIFRVVGEYAIIRVEDFFKLISNGKLD
jgi:hypothetical protein